MADNNVKFLGSSEAHYCKDAKDIFTIYAPNQTFQGERHGWVHCIDGTGGDMLVVMVHPEPSARVVMMSRIRRQLQTYFPATLFGGDIAATFMPVLEDTVAQKIDTTGSVTITTDLRGLPIKARVHISITKMPNGEGVIAEMAFGLGNKVDYMETRFPVNHMELKKPH